VGASTAWALAARLEEEVALASSSRYAVYLRTLPEVVECVAAWTPAERQLLAGTSLAKIDGAPRSACLVESRAVHRADGTWVLAPGVDSLNDSRGLGRPATYVDDDGDSLAVIATRDVTAGEEITHVYDDLVTPADLLCRYGFWPPRDGALPVSVVVPAADLVVDDRRRADDCRSLLGHRGLALTVDDPLPDLALGVVLLQCLDDDDDYVAALALGRDLDVLAALRSDADLAVRVTTALGAVVRRRLDRYCPDDAYLQTTTIPPLSDGDPPPPPRALDRVHAARQLRDAEVAVLRACLAALDRGFDDAADDE